MIGNVRRPATHPPAPGSLQRQKRQGRSNPTLLNILQRFFGNLSAVALLVNVCRLAERNRLHQSDRRVVDGLRELGVRDQIVPTGLGTENLQLRKGMMPGKPGRIHTKLAQLTTEIGQLTTKIGQLTIKIGQLTSEIGQLTSEIGQLTREIGQLTREIGPREAVRGLREYRTSLRS